VDPKIRDFSKYRGASLLTPNLRELGDAVGLSLDAQDLPGVINAARTVLRLGICDDLLVTMGDRGMLIVMADDKEMVLPTLKRAVYDVTGAGDTAVAVLTACLTIGATLPEAAHIANAAAGIAVGEVGAVAVPASRIAAELAGTASNKVFSRDGLQIQLSRWRSASERIIFTNGCFDLLHPGHLSLLQFAKSLGDRLVLAINSDAAVRRLKGPGRPVVSQQDRAAMLSALACVDAVVIFEEDTPLEIIKFVCPAILVKGQDYRMDEVIGRSVVEAAGGRVVLAPLLANYSTTALIARAQA
jgi:D-beta-D-heptose 7-phosphate kinase/D-beta-D-heptose 1-phosphate adenosyltransferase